jgi:hypothetical protein
MLYTTGVSTWAEADLTAFGRSIIDDADEATFKATVNLEIGTDVQAYNASLAAIAGGTWTGAASITTLGTITTGTWSATAIGVPKGGTGLTTVASGDILYASAADTLASLAKGTAN